MERGVRTDRPLHIDNPLRIHAQILSIRAVHPVHGHAAAARNIPDDGIARERVAAISKSYGHTGIAMHDDTIHGELPGFERRFLLAGAELLCKCFRLLRLALHILELVEHL